MRLKSVSQESGLRKFVAGARLKVQLHQANRRANSAPASEENRFLRTLLRNPSQIGAVVPSSDRLAQKMASFVDPTTKGAVIELGGGTGPVTKALLKRGVDPKRLVVIEYDPEFCHMLRRKFPKITVVQGDAYHLRETLQCAADHNPKLARLLQHKVAAVVSSLPLLNQPLERRRLALAESLALLETNAPFIQFTYGLKAPVARDPSAYHIERAGHVWLNMPPAHVWLYRSLSV
jgi:phosphatidylethanolamine/phosphatidyl-N-methylethanolamine N-methyltransferase